MSEEFWLGVLVSSALFGIGTLVSIFSSDIRSYILTWRKNRTLKGVALKIAKTERELSQHQHLSSNHVVASAYFWSGLFLILMLGLLLGLAAFLSHQISESSGLRPFLGAMIGLGWLILYAFSNELYTRANSLRCPEVRTKALEAKLNELRGRLN